MSQSITRNNFDEWMMPVYAPAALFRYAVKVHACGISRKRVYRFCRRHCGECPGTRSPQLIRALTEQAGKFWHTGNGYTNEPVLRLAKQLIDATFADRVSSVTQAQRLTKRR